MHSKSSYKQTKFVCEYFHCFTNQKVHSKSHSDNLNVFNAKIKTHRKDRENKKKDEAIVNRNHVPEKRNRKMKRKGKGAIGAQLNGDK